MRMQNYRNRPGNTGHSAYAIHGDVFIAHVVDGGTYHYVRASVRTYHPAAKKKRARDGTDLSAYIFQHRGCSDYER